MKRKFDFFVWMVQKDGYFCRLADFIHGAKRLWGWRHRKWAKLGWKTIREQHVDGGKMFVVLNGPSAKKQPLERIVGKGFDISFVNQGFRLPAYKALRPKYHFFVDTKMLNGVWDIHWIDEILEMVPDITFVFPAAWGNEPILKPYIDRGLKILWFSLPAPHGVSSAAFNLSWALGYKEVYFTGYEGTAFPAMLMKQASHFYGADPDEDAMTPRDIMKIFMMSAWHFDVAIASAEYAKKHGLKLVNLTDGGIMDMYERKNFDEVFPA